VTQIVAMVFMQSSLEKSALVLAVIDANGGELICIIFLLPNFRMLK